MQLFASVPLGLPFPVTPASLDGMWPAGLLYGISFIARVSGLLIVMSGTK